MTDEQTAETPEETPAPAPEPRVEIVKEFVVDTTPIDSSIATLRKVMETADESQLPSIEAQIQQLEVQKQSAATQADLAELAELRKSRFEQELSKILPAGIEPSEIPGNTHEERLAAAQAIARVSQKVTATDEAEEKRIEELAKKIAAERFGGNLVPSGAGATAAADDIAELSKAVEEGRPEDVMRNPAFRQKYEKIPSGPLPS